METINISYKENNEEMKIKIKLDKNQRFIKIFNKPISLALIEILENDNIPNDKYLYPDLNYKKGFKIYEKKNFCLAGYSGNEIKNNKKCIYSGEIKTLFDRHNFLFEHSLRGNTCIVGSPISLMDNDFIIGIHTPVNINSQGYGFFIGYILD